MTSAVYEINGLRIETPIALPARPSGSASNVITITVESPEPTPDGPPPGTLLAGLHVPGGYALVEDASGYILRFFGLCDFRIAQDLRRVAAVPGMGADRDLMAVLIGGNLVATILGLQDRCVLHATAVAADDTAIAIAGGSGAGKSTLAALLCAAGARMVSEDLVTVQAGGELRCEPGVHQLRLRTSAVALGALFPGVPASRLPDGRLLLRLPPHEGRPRLSAVLLPQPSREATQLSIRRLAPPEAVLRLACYPRILGWQRARTRAGQFRGIARLAQEAAVFSALVPWGPPFDAGLAGRLLELSGAAVMTP